MFPPIALIVPFFILFNALDILDSVGALILVYTAMNLPLVVWLLRDYFRGLPIELEEASIACGIVPGPFSYVWKWEQRALVLLAPLSSAISRAARSPDSIAPWIQA